METPALFLFRSNLGLAVWWVAVGGSSLDKLCSVCRADKNAGLGEASCFRPGGK